MTVNPLTCSLSSWTGLEGYCRWCNNEIPDLICHKRKWCSGGCLDAWRQEHRYFLARQFVMRRARGKCLCVRADNEPRHVVCSSCGSCEAQVHLRGGQMTCDHIVPRFGQKAKFSCNHHIENLQVLCSTCHHQKTLIDEETYGIDSGFQ